MDLQLKDELFVITGASSGFGRSIAVTLLKEGAKVILNARRKELLVEIEKLYPGQVEYFAGDITEPEVRSKLIKQIGNRRLGGLVVNSGGPPAKSCLETNMADWDRAYNSVMRWKIDLVNSTIQSFRNNKYGRILFIESVSVKQPVENLVLSNSFRMGMVGYVKTLSDEVASDNVTLNVLAPGYHGTAAIDRLIKKKSEVSGLNVNEVIEGIEKSIPVGRLGKPDEFASLAVWLLSKKSAYITGQTITVDGGAVRHSFG